MSRRLVLVRHGAAAGARGRAIGHSDPPLSTAGQRAVERLAATWQGPPPHRLLASPLARAADTASVLAAAWGMVPARPEPRLAEMSFGAWDGRRWDEIHAADGDRLAAWADHWWQVSTPDGEGFADLVRRVGEWWDEWRADDEGSGGENAAAGWGAENEAAAGRGVENAVAENAAAPRVTVAVTHAGPVRALLVGHLGVPRQEVWDLPIGLARVTAVDVAAEGPPRLAFLDRAGFPAPGGG